MVYGSVGGPEKEINVSCCLAISELSVHVPRAKTPKPVRTFTDSGVDRRFEALLVPRTE